VKIRLVLMLLMIAVSVVSFGRAVAPQSPVTFSEDVAPIIFNNCAPCHRPGEAAPFPLLSYEDVQRRGKLIASVTDRRYMPPWHADSQMGVFRDDRRLTESQIGTIREWLRTGMAEGDPRKTPPTPKFTPGWQLGEPDLIVRMDEAFPIPSDGPDLFRSFAIKLDLKQDRWVTAIEFRGSSLASHHALFFLDSTGQAVQADQADPRPGFGGMNFVNAAGLGLRGALARGSRGAGDTATPAATVTGLGGWAVGGSPRELPEGLARFMARDSDLVLQMHFHPTGKPEREQATIGFHFADGTPKRTLSALQMPPLFGALAGIDIPAGESAFAIKDSFTIPVDVEVIGLGGHAHYLAKEMRMIATLPDGSKKDLARIPDWDFNWQERYYFKQPVRLPRGTRLDVAITYDNSERNPNNPASPPKRVTFGRESTDEMGSMTLEVVAASERELPLFNAAVRLHLQSAVLNVLATPGARAGRGR
jgi:hypothetical protein